MYVYLHHGPWLKYCIMYFFIQLDITTAIRPVLLVEKYPYKR